MRCTVAISAPASSRSLINVRRKSCGENALTGGLPGPLLQRAQYRLVAQPPDRDRAGFVDRTQQRPYIRPAHREPICNRRRPAVEIGGAILTALAAAHRNCTCLRYIVAQVERDDFAPTQTAAAEQRDQRGVARAGRTLIGASRKHQRR
jgi:hypothetical protein